METSKPTYRFELRAAFLKHGYKRVSDIADACGCRPEGLYQVFEGWRFPGPEIQKAMAGVLGMTLKELRTLL
jgi:hypothetical protein